MTETVRGQLCRQRPKGHHYAQNSAHSCSGTKSREWLQIYPQARVLAASGEDLAGDRRRQFVARVAANDWDAVIMTRSAFTRLPVSTDTEAAYERRQVAQLREMLERAKGDRGLTVKVIEKQIARREEKLKTVLDAPRDPGVTFEETGVDYLLIDFTSRPFRVRLVRSRGCGAGWRTRGRGCARSVYVVREGLGSLRIFSQTAE